MSKNILITGSAGGIGSALTKVLKENDHTVIGVDLAEDINVDSYYQCDLSKNDEWEKVLNQIKEDHSIDIVINNAGMNSFESFEEDGVELFNKIMNVNFHSAVRSTHFWLTHMKEGGVIANMGSMAGIISPAGMTAYSASKHALVGFTESLQMELEYLGSDKKIVLINPGFVDTPIMKIGSIGLPEKFRFLVETPEACAKNIYKGLMSGQSEIVPTYNAHIMKLANRFAPKLLKMSNLSIGKMIHKK